MDFASLLHVRPDPDISKQLEVSDECAAVTDHPEHLQPQKQTRLQHEVDRLTEEAQAANDAAASAVNKKMYY